MVKNPFTQYLEELEVFDVEQIVLDEIMPLLDKAKDIAKKHKIPFYYVVQTACNAVDNAARPKDVPVLGGYMMPEARTAPGIVHCISMFHNDPEITQISHALAQGQFELQVAESLDSATDKAEDPNKALREELLNDDKSH